MKIDFTKSGMNKWSLLILYILMVTFMLFRGIKDFNVPYNAHLQLGEFIAYDSGDTHSYLDQIEEYIQTGEYSVGSVEEKNVGRGPYYGAYYYLFRQFLPTPKALDALAILQILWYALAIILLMLIVEPYIKYKAWVWLFPCCIFLLHTGLLYLPRIATDAIATSQLICFAYFYVRFNRTGNLWSLGWAALFLAMASVMKPYLLPIYALCFFDWAFANKIFNFKRWATYVGIMSLPLVVICLPFTIRNAVTLHTFAPMQNTMYAGGKNDPVNAAMRNMVRVWGENHTEWGGLGTFFMPCEGFTYNHELPSHIYTNEYSKEDLYMLAEQCQEYQILNSGYKKDSLEGVLVETMTRYKNAYITEHPLWRIRASYKQMTFLIQPPSLNFNHRHTGIRHFISNGLVLLSWGLAWLLLIGGAMGLLLIIRDISDLRFVTWITLYILLFFSLLLAGEGRFFLIGKWLNAIGLVVLCDKCISSVLKHKN